MLLGYKEKCVFDLKRYFPNILQTGDPVRHSQKPDASYQLIESVSHTPRLELFARQRRQGWHSWGNEITPTTAELRSVKL
jgi:N6-adenosine-specific RNA methylase IME4